MPQSLDIYADEPPAKNPQKYAAITEQKALTRAFFAENVERARDRNERAKEIEAMPTDGFTARALKTVKTARTRLAEANFMRYLRRQDKPGN